jgi:hypothetical protein
MAPKNKAVLLTFTGFHDPYHKSLVAGEELEGPILSLLSLKDFQDVVLFSTPNTIDISEQTQTAILKEHPHVAVSIISIPLRVPLRNRECPTGC